MRALAATCLAAVCASCTTDPQCEDARCHFTDEEWRLLSAMADVPPPPPSPGNRYLTDPRAAALGQRLFFDARFSGASTYEDTLKRRVPTARSPMGQPVELSCASCHDLRSGGADPASLPSPISIGTGWMGANSPTVINVAYYPFFFWNGRIDSLWALTAGAVENRTSMNGSRAQTAQVLSAAYSSEYAAVFGEPPAMERGLFNFGKAVEAYLYRLVTHDSAFDRFMHGEGELPPAAIRGARLFVGKAACVDCHSGPMLTDGRMHNTGVIRYAPGVPVESLCTSTSTICNCVTPRVKSAPLPPCPVQGAYEGRWALERSPRTIDGDFSDLDPSLKNPARYGDAPGDELRGAWRTPSLRDVARTAPYMHNGSISDLWGVIRFYDEGGTSEGYAPERRSARIRPLGLTVQDAEDLVAFMESLTNAPLPEELLTP